jgi:hypothetical protein
VDVTHEASLPTPCPDCGGAVRHERVVSQYQEDLPVQHPVVHEFRVAVGACRAHLLRGDAPLHRSLLGVGTSAPDSVRVRVQRLDCVKTSRHRLISDVTR